MYLIGINHMGDFWGEGRIKCGRNSIDKKRKKKEWNSKGGTTVLSDVARLRRKIFFKKKSFIFLFSN